MTVANKPYQKYVPWFLYFLNRAYPEAHKLILLDEKITDGIKPMISLLSGNFEIRECAFPEYSTTDANTIKCLRWLIFEPTFLQYDCMSIGDVDMAILFESPSYMDQHLTHCNQLKIPYSNCIRPKGSGPRRMSGIHVIKPKEWFEVMKPIIEKYRPMLLARQIHLLKHGFNEQLLLKMIIESDLGKPPLNLSKAYWSSLVTSHHHGVHIPLAECRGMKGLQMSKGYRCRKEGVLAAIDTPLFRQLSSLSPHIGGIFQAIAKEYRKNSF